MTHTPYASDHEITSAIEDELAWTPNVHAEQILVTLEAGVVTLSGHVRSYPEKEAAVGAALRVRGVTAVADQIVVHNTEWRAHEDSDIARAAGHLLDNSVVVPQGAVKAAVHDRVVTLSGSVAWQYQREAARRAAASLPGVRWVHNMVDIKPLVGVSPTHTKSKITAALIRSAQLDAEHIDVVVTGSSVHLIGWVTSWAERRAATNAAWGAPGVTHVENDLRVQV